MGTAVESLTPLKGARISAVADAYCDANAGSPEERRIDVIAVDLTPQGRLLRLEHIENAFSGDELPELSRRLTMFKLSSFRLRVFRECRRRYRYRYVEGMPTRPSAHNTMGAHVHNTLKAFFSLPEPAERTPERLLDLLLESWQQNRSGFSDLDDEERWRERAVAQMRTFAERAGPRRAPADAGGVPRSAASARSSPSSAASTASTTTPDGLHVIDYKTGRRPEEVDVQQLHLYTVMLERSLARPVARASYLYLDDGSAWSASPQRRRARRGAGVAWPPPTTK